MKSCSTNDVKIYNLSAGKSLPDWISERKRRTLQKSDIGVRRRIELIQDFDMPGVSSNIQMSSDGNYILATGIYKPRVRCYDVKNLSMKFERCFDSEVIRFISLSQDYSKLVFLQCDRYIEFHAQFGRYYRLRIPKFGRDLAYHTPSCDLFVGGATHELYRLNLELGRFMTPWETEAKGINRLEINPLHHLVTLGTEEGRVEGWDPRSGKLAGRLDCALHALTQDTDVKGVPSVTSLKFKDGLTLGVGTSTGQVLLYDIRSSKPLLVKDHFYSLPMRDIEFHPSERLVLSMDEKIVKIWKEDNGQAFTSVEAESQLNDLCLVPNTGMFFVANEDKKILVYYVPSLGPAPRWCSFLDNLTEELEESDVLAVYDDYKFVTEKELNEIGLAHLVGTNLLRAYMHGYFMDMRLYRKAKAVVQPFQFDDFKKKKIKEKLQEQRSNRVRLNALPKVNKDLALKFMSQPVAGPGSSGKKGVSNLLEDDRFKVMFENPDFEIDKGADEFRLLNPVLSKLDNKKAKKLEAVFKAVEEEEEKEGKGSSDEDDFADSDSGDSDSDEMADGHGRPAASASKAKASTSKRQKGGPKFYELKSGADFKITDLHKNNNEHKLKRSKTTLGDRLEKDDTSEIKSRGPLGSREITFAMHTRKQRNFREDAQAHHQERKKLRRPTGSLKNKKNSWKK